MPQASAGATMDEDDARRVLLARAIETAGDGSLLPADERERIDRAAREETLREAGEADASPQRLLRLRADRVIAAAAVREPGLAGLLEPLPWPGRVAWALPLLAFIAGAASDWLGDPHRVNLLAIPLLGLLAWNLTVYLALLVALFGRRGPPGGWLAGIVTWTDGERALRRGGPPRLQARLLFQRDWLRASRRAEAARWTRALHLSAAGWALGWLASLVLRGMVVEYRVGWESTFLGPAQVHALLAAMRWPAAWLLALPPLTLAQVQDLHFSVGGGAAAGGRDWVLMVAVLLAALVVLPRLALAMVSALQGLRARTRIAVDLDDAYHRRILSLLDAGRVALALVATPDEDAQWLRRRLAQEPGAWPVLGVSGQGDELRVVPALQAAAPAGVGRVAGNIAPWARWPWARALPAREPLRAQAALCVARSVEQATAAHLAAGGLPLLVLWRGVALPGNSAGVRSLHEDEAAACWVQRPRFYGALGSLLPQPGAEAVARIAREHAAQDAVRLQQSMHAAALHLMGAAREQQELHGLSTGLGGLLPAARREAAQAQEQAMEAILARLRASTAQYLERLRLLHGLEPGELALAERQVEKGFEVATPLHAPQAGMAGAATGAALGAGVDLAAGGLTLGAAAALGALVGGGAAYVGALWKNRTTPGGGAMVQLSDAMLQALAEAALLQYLAVAHVPGAPSSAWAGHVADSLRARSAQLLPFWSQARTQPELNRLAQPLGHLLEAAARETLGRIHPGSDLSS